MEARTLFRTFMATLSIVSLLILSGCADTDDAAEVEEVADDVVIEVVEPAPEEVASEDGQVLELDAEAAAAFEEALNNMTPEELEAAFSIQ